MPASAPLPRLVLTLGWISLFMDLSTEAINSILPAFMAGLLGLGASEIGLIQGLGELGSTVLQDFSGRLSDRLQRRRGLILLGYSLSALSKPLFALAHGLGGLLLAQVSDRSGKGLRDAPRNALLAAHILPQQRGAAFGLRQAMDTLGALLGPLSMMLMLSALHLPMRLAMLVCFLPALMCVVLIIAALPQDPARQAARPAAPVAAPWARESGFQQLLFIAGALSLARFNEGFLILDLHDEGIRDAHLPWLMIIMNSVYALLALPAGKLSDRWPRPYLLAAAVALLLLATSLMAVHQGPFIVFIAGALWGAHLALSQGVMSALIADHSPEAHRAQAFGRYALVSGVALLIGNVLLGALIDHLGWGWAMLWAAIWSALSLLLILRLPPVTRVSP